MNCPVCAISERLIEIMGRELLRECREMADEGLTRVEINQVLTHLVPIWEAWRTDMLRALDEPNAPSLETHEKV